MGVIRSQGRALMNEISVLIKEASESSVPLPRTMRSLQPERGRSLDHPGSLMSDSLPPELREINLCCLQATQSMAFCDSSPDGLKHQAPLQRGHGQRLLARPNPPASDSESKWKVAKKQGLYRVFFY